jgi:hypothetical protein
MKVVNLKESNTQCRPIVDITIICQTQQQRLGSLEISDTM